MCHSDLLTSLIKHLFQHDKSKISVLYMTNLKLSLLINHYNITGWMKAPRRIHVHKIQSLEDYIVSQHYFKHF